MRQVTFVKPFCSSDPSNKTCPEIKPYLPKVYEDNEVLTAVQKLEQIFLEKKQCLVHGDFHTGSVMVDGEDVKVMIWR